MQRDLVEQTKEYKIALKIIQPELDKLEKQLSSQEEIGSCHRYWNLKKQLLKNVGINWYSPAELNPDILFD